MGTKKQESRAQYWREQIEQAKSFPGTATEYCRQQGLNLTAFYSWRKRFKIEERSVSPFAAVEVMSDGRADWLPDAKWLAEFVHHLRGVRP